ncbi:hypothetical protein SOVF_113150 isoform A [Spinacia oleracea]|uniref:Uncharacterized protein isoform X2 n=1 Tax=Spinacia oleracea TaxID=3562 RepID=A0ABM3R2M1_SPIOL|nr:uncharacterized protein LOC110785329 isoform X2 [Spinacia oleracea]KNA13766.1 hypothetical protein SOVF_113150 isoform A [Spinacia oleracea]
MTTSHLTHINLILNRQFHTPNSSPCNISSKLISPRIIKYPSFLISITTLPLFKPNLHNAAQSVVKCFARDETHDSKLTQQGQKQEKKSFWAAVSLIIGTAVGPGMLGLPSATIKSGPLPSTVAILLSWVYVISSIILVAELSFATMEEDGVKDVSFTGLAIKAFGAHFGAFVSIVYASLSFSLLVACVSGIGSIVSQWFPSLNNVVSHGIFPMFLGSIIWFFPFRAIDSTNRFLCFMMLISIITLVGIGVSVARANLLISLSNSSWHVFSILPAIPVTVLTLGFHVITPFICKVAGDTIDEARKAILIGGTVPLVMVLSWNLIVLGLAGTGTAQSSSLQGDPIKLLLSVKSSALFAVQGFAFSALATSFIGYSVSFPKQLVDTLELIFRSSNSDNELGAKETMRETRIPDASDGSILSGSSFRNFEGLISVALFLVPVLVASFYPSTFSRALDFAGVYANCFLFGILPPAMAYIFKSRRKLRSSLPGGNVVLFLLFSTAVILSIWH